MQQPDRPQAATTAPDEELHPDDGSAPDSEYDDVFGELEAPAYEEPPKPSLAKRALHWLIAIAVIAAVATGGKALGQRYYNPESRLPAPVAYPLQVSLTGVNERVLSEVRVASGWFPSGEIELSLAGDVYELAFPRTVADRLFDKRDETATVFTATTAQGGEHRFLVLKDGLSEPVLAIEAPASPTGASGVEGLFLRLPPADADAPLANVAAGLADVLPSLQATRKQHLTSSDYTLFGPFGRGDQAALQQRIDANIVLSHLAARLEAADADVSIAAPYFSISEAPEDGFIRAIYTGRMRLVMEPAWEAGETATLGHELTHAYVSRVLPDEAAVLREVADYMDESHPRLFRDLVGDLYENLDRSSRAEEALAFVTGAVAAGQTKTIAADRLLSNQGLASVTDPVLRSDIELLVRLGLLPDCMQTALGETGAEVGFDYYRDVAAVCGTPASSR